MLMMLRNRALVAHNATFDLAFLGQELGRAGWAWPTDSAAVCTLKESFHFQPQLDRRRLADCCWAAGVPLTDAHSALGDARAAAALFASYVRSSPQAPIARGYDALLSRAGMTAWPTTPTATRPSAPAQPTARGRQLSEAARRNIARSASPRPRLLEAFTLSDALDDGAARSALPYLELLAEALEDGELSDQERVALADLTGQYGLSPQEVDAAHRGFVRALAREAVDDGRVTPAERAELRATAALLGVSDHELGGLLTGQEQDRLEELSANLPPLPRTGTWGSRSELGSASCSPGVRTLAGPGLRSAPSPQGFV